MKSQLRTAPKVLEYLDALVYLQDYYRYRKITSADFSYEKWSQELGFKSRSFLRMILIGKKKITPKFIDAFTQLAFSTKLEGEYFYYLVKFSQSATQKDRQAFSQKLMRIQRQSCPSLHIDSKIDFVSDPLLPRLLALLSFTDIDSSLSGLSRVLKRETGEILMALKKLEDMNLARKSETGGQEKWLAITGNFKVPDHYGDYSLRNFHELSLQEALTAFDRPKDLRRYKSLLLPMSPEEISEFHQLLDEFAEEQRFRFNSSSYLGRRMFQVNFNIYAVSEPLEEVASVTENRES